MRLVFARAARADLQVVRRYTRGTWGAAQEAKYMAEMRHKFELLLQHPELGSGRPDIDGSYRCLIAGRHAIYYRLKPATIEIIRVLHQSMDAVAHLGEGI